MHMHKSDALLTLRNMHFSDTFYNTKCFFNGIISGCSPRVLIFFFSFHHYLHFAQFYPLNAHCFALCSPLHTLFISLIQNIEGTNQCNVQSNNRNCIVNKNIVKTCMGNGYQYKKIKHNQNNRYSSKVTENQ
jgi:hypothetical protein